MHLNICVMYLSIGESYFRGCDGFSHVEKRKSNIIFYHVNNLTLFIQAQNINKNIMNQHTIHHSFF